MNADHAVCVFENSPQFFPSISERLAIFDIEVSGGRFLDHFEAAWRNPQKFPVLLTVVDSMTLRWLKQHDFLKQRCHPGNSIWVIVADDEAVYEEICAMEVPGAMVLAKNVAIKRLTYLVLQFFSKYHGYRESGRYLTIGAGELGEINLKSLLGKLDDAKFSGRLLVRINSQETRIHFQDGKISGMLPVAYPGNESLKAILSSKKGNFRVEQAIVQWDELIHQDNQDISLENRDVLVDMFYYIHRHFDDIGRGELFLEKAAGDNLHRRWLADHGIFLSINTASHEKLDILGHLDESGITRIVAWLASLFENIVESQEAFAAFFSGLAEIRQFVTTLPGMADFAVPPSPEPVPLSKLEPKTPAARALFASVQSGKVIPKVLESL